MSISTGLRIVACVCFVIAAVGVTVGPLGLVPLGLALWVGSTLP